MIGGTVIETIVLPDKVWVNCEDDHNSDRCAIYVKNTAKSRTISNGDTVWWQGGWALWTPRDSHGKAIGKADIRIERVGFSGVRRPEIRKEQA